MTGILFGQSDSASQNHQLLHRESPAPPECPAAAAARGHNDTPGGQVLRRINIQAGGKLQPLGCIFAFLDEPLLHLCHPRLQQSLCLSVICLLHIHSLPGNLLTKRHDQHRLSQDAVYPQVYLSAGGTLCFAENAANTNTRLKPKTRSKNPQYSISIFIHLPKSP